MGVSEEGRSSSNLRISFLSGSFEIYRALPDGTKENLTIPRGTTGQAFAYLAMQKNLRRLTLQTLADTLAMSPNTVQTGISRNKRDLPIAQTPFGWDIDPDQVDVLLFERLGREAVEKYKAGVSEEALGLATQALEIWKHDLPDFAGPLADEQERFRVLRNELRTLIRSLSAGKGAVLHNLPPRDEQDLVGRRAAADRVMDYLRPYPHSSKDVVLIDGVGGVGKTALAKAIAYSYVDGGSKDFAAIVWISGKTTELDTKIRILPHRLRCLEDIYQAIALTLRRTDILEKSPVEKERLIRGVLSDHENRVLLIVDNLETVEDPEVLSFVEHPPVPTRVLATARHRIDSGTYHRLSGLQEEAARELILKRAETLQISLDDEAIADLAKATAGVPLAIFFTLGQVAIGYPLNEAIDRLRSSNQEYAEFAFHESLRLLDGDSHRNERELLYAAALFADGASAAALGYVAGLSEGLTGRALMTLNHMSILNFRNNRFSMLSLTRDFAAGELGRDRALNNRVTQRWLEWHEQLAVRASKVDLDTGILEELRQEHNNVIAAIEYAYRNDARLFYKFVTSMAFFWMIEGLWNEFEHYVGLAKAATPIIGERIRLSNRLLWLAVLRMDLELADVHKLESERLLQRVDDAYERMRLLDFSGQLAMARGDVGPAEETLTQGLREAQSQDDRRGIFATLKYLGEVSCMKGDIPQAQQRYEAASQHLGGPGAAEWLRGQAHLAHLQGLIAEASSDPQTAIAAYDDCLGLLSVHRDIRLATRAKKGKARALTALGSVVRARAVYRDLAADFERLGMWEACNEAHELSGEGQHAS